ncbi:MAG: flagellar basal body rod protein FlgB [Proteobacteria bacterium]|nr:flagellar basal body rod protein FlgB [Pseudomonadota bacterium]
MDYSKLPIYQMMQQQLKYDSTRQTVLAKNIANVDTPGYVPSDVKAPNFSEILKHKTQGRLAMAVTQPGHLGTSTDAKGNLRIVKDKVTERSPNGNAVSLDDQMLKMQENSSDYQSTTTLYRKMSGMFRIALGESN